MRGAVSDHARHAACAWPRGVVSPQRQALVRVRSRGAVRITRCRGMTLVECLVALLVLTIGMIGVAQLLITGLRNGYFALLRTQAVNLVSDMAERIRANPEAGVAYDCARYAGAPAEQGCAATDVAASAACSSADLAQDDLARWQATVKAALPVISDDTCAANVVYTAPVSSDEPIHYRVSVTWLEAGTEEPLIHRADLLVSPP